ncbi:hypothetical protein TREMEDRAFT_59561 [Tremella mesenterica DSM 1558]|uniref:uncharacterized protein n=1 Tax=Tremella mesenterica (strain ATCC 24925 / CBS 8224 / DSM 1558 / NBRC 9311 / NRRL Y-6157 / RJB 2259-6 / UBC 559-6) TaxID=578456 RepID=UPI0003F49B0D|nr:uncharacterized protein TREMEDRAFT_59561 [Tremella mesenterica DSM 1558]EIW73397.1 hypothetical protein TREMEDRAFT_59561 [Tremella mesenterica DSM 1558]
MRPTTVSLASVLTGFLAASGVGSAHPAEFNTSLSLQDDFIEPTPTIFNVSFTEEYASHVSSDTMKALITPFLQKKHDYDDNCPYGPTATTYTTSTYPGYITIVSGGYIPGQPLELGPLLTVEGEEIETHKCDVTSTKVVSLVYSATPITCVSAETTEIEYSTSTSDILGPTPYVTTITPAPSVETITPTAGQIITQTVRQTVPPAGAVTTVVVNDGSRLGVGSLVGLVAPAVAIRFLM